MTTITSERAVGVDEARWASVLRRDRSADGSFVFAVRTTGIYCRPSCPARRPRREHVELHESPESARRAGFRPCRRCRPDAFAAETEARMRLVARACERLERSVRVPSLEALAREAGLAPAKFRTLFVDAVGVTPAAFARARREARVRDELGRGASVTRALHGAGYGSSGRFYEGPGRSLGMAPSIYRRGAPGERIEFALGASTLGVVLVAATRRGVCAVELGARPQPLLRSLHRRFHRATIVRGGSAMRSLVRRVLAAVESPETTIGSNAGAAPGLPLDLLGTAFQLRVWQALRCIRPGETRSYGEIARGVGAPRAGRAVAAACAANPVAVVIPCHRVIGADGTLAGYRWGLSRKRALLSRECRAPSPCA